MRARAIVPLFAALSWLLTAGHSPAAADAERERGAVVDFEAQRIAEPAFAREPALSLGEWWRAEGFPVPAPASAQWRLVDPLYRFEQHGPNRFTWSRADGCVQGEGILFRRRMRAEWFYDDSCGYEGGGGRATGQVELGEDGSATAIVWKELERISGEGEREVVKRRVDFRPASPRGGAIALAGHWMSASSGTARAEYFRIDQHGDALTWTHENGCEVGSGQLLDNDVVIHFACDEDGISGRARGRIELDAAGNAGSLSWSRVELRRAAEEWAASTLPSLVPAPPPPPPQSLQGLWREQGMPPKDEFAYDLRQDAKLLTTWWSQARCEQGTVRIFQDWLRADWSVRCEAGCSPCDAARPRGRAVGRLESADRIVWERFERISSDGKVESRLGPVVFLRQAQPAPADQAMKAARPPKLMLAPGLSRARAELLGKLVHARGVDPEERTLPQGPDPLPLNLEDVEWRGLSKQQLGFESLQDLLPIQTRIHPDRNRDSGVFYYVPFRYTLERDSEGYGMSLRYRSKDESGANATVIARLDANIDPRSHELVRRLIRLHYLEQLIDHDLDEIRLQPYPGDAEVELDWDPITRGEMKIAPVHRLDDQIDLVLTADTETARLFIDVIGESGLAGKVRIGAKDAAGPQKADLLLQLERRGSRSQPWLRPAAADPHVVFENPLPAPVRPLYLVWLYDEGEWLRLGGFRLVGPNGGTLGIEHAGRIATSALGSEVLDPERAIGAWWLYEVIDDAELREAALERIVRAGASEDVERHTLTLLASEAVFEKFGLEQLQVEVRSRYFDALNQKLETRTYKFRAGDEDKQMDPVYPRHAPEQLYEYRITAVDGTGRSHSDGKWRTPETPADIIIGEFIVSELMAP